MSWFGNKSESSGGLTGFVKKQFLDIIEWEDNSQDAILFKFPMQDNEIQNGGKLVVRPGQVAIFLNEGKIADVFQEGTHALTTQNLPILGDLKGWAFGFKSPFKADVYFINTKQFLNQKWGTPQPIWITDPKFEQIEVRAFGTFAFKIADPVQFIREVTSTNKTYTVEEIREQLKAFIVTNFASIVATQNLSIAELSKNYALMNGAVMESVKQNYTALGLEMTAFVIANISLPEELKEALTKRSTINMMGGMQNFAQVETLEAMKESVKNPGMNAMNQAGMGLGMGLNFGTTMASNMQAAYQNVPGQQPQINLTPVEIPKTDTPAAVEVNTIECAECHGKLPANAMFCSKCGTKVVKPEPKPEPAEEFKFCTNCGGKMSADSLFCGKCGNKFG